MRVLETDGQTETDLRTGLKIRDARGITLVVTVIENPVFSDGYKILRKRHVEDYQEIVRRMELFLGEQPDIPTDERLKAFREGKEDVPLYALYFQYGRYLLMSSSRGRDSLPATLQGIWCWEMRPPWSSQLDYEHQYADELLAGAQVWPVRVRGALSGMDEASGRDGSGDGPELFWMRGLVRQSQCGRLVCLSSVGRPSGETLAHTEAVSMPGFRWEAYGCVKKCGGPMSTTRTGISCGRRSCRSSRER